MYCAEDDVNDVQAAARLYTRNVVFHSNGHTRADLHNNTQKDVHIVTDQRLMRGFDYRAPTVGFALLIA